MKSIQEVKTIVSPKAKLLETFTCDGCGRSVERKEMVIPIGPRKGEIIIADLGCKCEDIRLVEKAIKQGKANKTKKIQKLFDGHSMMNKALERASFSTYHPPTVELHEAKRSLMEYANNFDAEKSGNLLLVGPYGTGKSHLAVSVTRHLMEKGYKCLFLSVPKLLTKIKQTYSGNSKFSEADVLELVESVDLFVLDDLGTEYTNKRQEENDSWTHTKLFEVLDSRSGKPTIFTTNLSSDQLVEKLNERNLSRVLDGTKVIKMNGNDYRRKGF